MEQEQKSAMRFLRWPWNVIIYILLAIALRLFAIPVILILMGLKNKYNPHGIAEGYCLSRTRKRLPGLLFSLLFLLLCVMFTVVFFNDLRQSREDWGMQDYLYLIVSGVAAVAMLLAGIYEGFTSARDTFFPAKSTLAKSIRSQLPLPDEAPPVGELFATVDNDLRAHGDWFDTVAIGNEWVLGDMACRIDRIRAIFTVDKIHHHHTQSGISTNRTLRLVLVDDRWQAAITTFRKPGELKAAADCLGFRVPSAYRGTNSEYIDFLAKDDVERETFEREFRRKEAARASNRAMRDASWMVK